MKPNPSVLRVPALLSIVALGLPVSFLAAAETRPEAPAELLRQQVEAVAAQLDSTAREQPAAPDPNAAPSAQAGASAPTLEQLAAALAEIRARLEQLEAQNAEQQDSLSALDESEHREVHIAVYGNVNATAYDGRNSVFDAESFELILSGQPVERLGFYAEIELESAGEVGGERASEVVIEQAYASVSILRPLNLRAGALLVPFGNYNVDHYAPNRDVVSRPLVSRVVAPGDWTDNGLGIYGEAVTGSLTLSYDACVVAGLDSHVTAAGLREARQPFGVDNNGDKAIAGRLAVNRLGMLQVGLSGYTGKYDDEGRHRLDGWAVDGMASLGRFRLVGEYNRLAAGRPEGPDAVYWGYNVRGTVEVGSLFLRRGAHGAAFPESTLVLVAQYGHVDVTGPLDGAMLESSESSLTLGLAYRPSHEWVLKLDRELNSGDGLVLVNGDRDAWLGAIGFVF